MGDPHIQELLLKQTSNDAAREKAKLARLEVDAGTPLYEGCEPEDTRLSRADDVDASGCNPRDNG